MSNDVHKRILRRLLVTWGVLVLPVAGMVHLLDAARSLANVAATGTIFALGLALLLYPVVLWLEREVIRFSTELLRTNIELMEVLGSAIAQRDSDSHAHNYRVTLYAIRLAQALQLKDAQIRDLIAGAFLHDVGKLGVSDAILLKPGLLTREEFDAMKNHVHFGVEFLSRSAWLKSAVEVVQYHHEKYDGSGYPQGLAGEQIPLNARIFALADVFDVLTSKRPYKTAMPFEKAMDIIASERGRHFDPKIVDIFAGIANDLFHQINAARPGEIETALRLLAQRYFREDAVLVEYLLPFVRHASAAG
jgi:response regulator RpfG family c-di-GMP phosphodiesterase